jgi:hypothetical protein
MSTRTTSDAAAAASILGAKERARVTNRAGTPQGSRPGEAHVLPK